MLVNHFHKFILESESLDLLLVRVFVRRGFNVFLDTVDLFILLVIFAEELGEVGVVHLELMYGVAVLREFVDEVVFLDGHGLILVLRKKS